MDTYQEHGSKRHCVFVINIASLQVLGEQPVFVKNITSLQVLGEQPATNPLKTRKNSICFNCKLMALE